MTARTLEIVRPDEDDWFEPDGHWGVRSHWVVAKEAGARVQVCEMVAGGGAESDVHDDAEQTFYVVEGRLEVDDGAGTCVQVGAGEALRVPAGVPHVTTKPGEEKTRYLVVTAATP
jgi:mannose-6-phosphate isomerase-like protein (cupin superfamily)